MATYDISPDTVKLLSDPAKTALGKNGKIVELKEVNKELYEITSKFIDVALLKWLRGNNACGPERGDLRKLLCGNATVNLVTVDCVTEDRGIISYLIASQPDKDNKSYCPIFKSMSRIELPPQWPHSITFASYFGKRTKKLRIVLSSKLPIDINIPLKSGNLNPQNKALYSLFLNHPDGLVPSDILCDEKIFKEFKELWKERRPEENLDWIEFPKEGKTKKDCKYWKERPEKATRKIHKMIAALNTSLAENGALSYAAFYQVRQLESKKRGEKFFLPLYYLSK